MPETHARLDPLPASARGLERFPPDLTGGDFAALYSRHFHFVWRCLRSLGVPNGALDDCAQEVFVTVHRRLETFRGESAFRSWLYGIVRNVASNQRRRHRRKGDLAPLDVESPSGDASPLEHAQRRQAADFVQRFLAGLDTKKREVFLLAALEEMSLPEVAEALAIPLNTAYTRWRRSRAEFQRALLRERGRHDER